MIFVGIDPGKYGGIAIIQDGTPIIVATALTKENFLDFIEWYAGQTDMCRVCLEKVHAMPKQGAVSMFTFGEGYGWLKGVLDLAKISYQEIPPQTWKKEFGLNSNKTNSIEVCKQLFPKISLTPAGKRVPQDGLAEALLMAEYARRKL